MAFLYPLFGYWKPVWGHLGGLCSGKSEEFFGASLHHLEGLAVHLEAGNVRGSLLGNLPSIIRKVRWVAGWAQGRASPTEELMPIETEPMTFWWR